jgi:hypothetical protein
MSETETNTISYRNPTRTTKGVNQRKEPTNFEWNNKDVTAYTDLDLLPPERLNMFQRRFLSKVDVTKGPVERSVIAMVRLKAPDYLGQEKDKDKTKLPERKEFLYYMEEWRGKDIRGIPLNPVSEHVEGKWTRQFTQPHFSQETGEIDYYQLDPARAQTIYYIPFSKKAVDDIIAKSVHTDKNSIVFTIKFASEDNPYGTKQMPTRNQFTYEQFVWPWNEIYKHNFKPTVQAYQEWVNSEKQKDSLSFNPQ